MRRVLVLLYPPVWRSQYGAEFRVLLEQCPLTLGTVLDVIGSALFQRVRLDEPWKVVGVPCLLFALAGVAWLPDGAVAASIPLPVLVGFWTVVRGGGVRNRGGGAAVRFALLAAWVPYMLLGVLIACGVNAPSSAQAAIPAVGLRLPVAWGLGWLGGNAGRVALWFRGCSAGR